MEAWQPDLAQGSIGSRASTPVGAVVVLIVEDSKTQALKLRRLLESHGYEVVAAGHGGEALAILATRRPTLIITDINMPEMDGYELCVRIKDDPHLKALPVILLTSLSEPKDILRGLECGADNFVVKPYDDEFLISRVRNAVTNLQAGNKADGNAVAEIRYDGQTYRLKTDWLQSIDLLISTYETAVRKNRELLEAKQKLERLAEEMSSTLEALAGSHEKLKSTQDQLIHSEKLQSVGRLAAGIAHEVKNPLAVLKLGVQYLGESPLAGEELAALVLKDMKDAVERGNLVISDLLDFSAVRTLSMAEGCVNDLIKKTLRFVRHDFTSSKVKVDLKLGEGLRPCLIDFQKMQQVLINIFVNACHAMPSGGTLTITTGESVAVSDDHDYAALNFSSPRYHAGDRLVVAEIRDTGTGISEEVLKKIFDPFFTTKKTGHGTGLGMAVTKQIVELHRGVISIQNADGGGAQVTITFTQ
jgi:signal transduction histidine kinase